MTLRLPTCFVVLLAAACAQPAAAQRHFPTDADVRETVRRVVDTRGAVGVVVGLLDADGSRRVITVSDADYDGRTLFEIGSITKVFTGILLAEMAERGEVRLDQPVAELLPAGVTVPSRGGRQITLVDLSTHSSALPRLPDNLRPADSSNPYADYTVAQLYEFLESHALRRDIGAEWEYSNLGVGLLGHALALRADTTWEALVTSRVSAPLGMSSTMITIPDSLHGRLAPGHDARGRPVANWDIPTLAGAGALRSSVDDMLTFLAANLDPPAATPLGRAIRRSHAVHYRRDERGGNGLGWGVSQTLSGRAVIGHEGGTGGYRTVAMFDPERRIGVVLLSNQGSSLNSVALHLLDERVPATTAGLARAFEVMAVTLAVLLVLGVFAAWRSTGGTRAQALRAAVIVAVCAALWLFATRTAAALGIIRFDTRPPGMLVVFAALLALAFGMGLSGVGRRLAAGLPLAVLVGVHAFRLPLELMMHRAYEYGLMPRQMSYSGLNFDIVTGILAIAVALLLATGHAGLRAVRIWNALGIILLLNIIVISWLSAPTPLRVFRAAPANTWVATPPYIWLPAVMVAFAILGHIIVYRRLRLDDAATRA